MPIQVDFITLGDASERLSTETNRVPPSTLRHWTEQLEEYEVHFTKRNNRNERVYYESDLKIFAFVRDLRNEFGRRTQIKDIVGVLLDRGDQFELRSREDAPQPTNPSNRTADLLNNEDIQRLMQSDRVKQFISIIVAETTKNLKEDLIKEIREELLDNRAQLISILEESDRREQEKLDSISAKLDSNDAGDKAIMEEIEKLRAIQLQPKSFMQRLLGK